jgi:Sulfite reductase, alpha subunit (flavoprotein)
MGDTEYPLFCECGKQVDADLQRLGAEAVLPRTDLGADFMVSYIGWSKNFWKTMAGVYGVAN